jgi:hypothetical protein
MGVNMKRFITTALLVGVTALNTACAEETGTTQETIVVAKTAGTTTTKETGTTKSSGGGVTETGTTRSAVDLMATPFRDAKQAGQLPANTTVAILERRGGWLRVKAAGKSGWVRLHQVRAGEGPQVQKSGEGLSMLKNVSKTGRSGAQGIVATTGIRGLSAEELTSAKPDPKAVGSMEASRASESAARAYASSAGLKEQNVPFLSKE